MLPPPPHRRMHAIMDDLKIEVDVSVDLEKMGFQAK
jgi:hypothetical protein